MTNTRWWTIAILGVAILLLVLVLFDDVGPVGRIGGLAAIAVLVGSWFILNRRASYLRGSAIALTVCVIVACAVGTAFYPSFAIAQCVAFPLLWQLNTAMRAAVTANVILALGVGIGFLVALGTEPADLVRTAITVGASLALSLALGFWFNRVYDLVAERDVLIEQLHAAQDQVAALGRDAGVLDERERLAREIHDTIAQDLTGLVLTAQRGRRALRSGNVPGAAEQFNILEDNARSALAETRGLVAAGAPVGVEGGLTTALNRLGERFERETGITVTVRAPGTAELDRASEVVLLRCAQEALANVRKHSNASAASVTVSTTHGTVVLRVADNGQGFDPAAVTVAGAKLGAASRLAPDDDDAMASGFGLAGLRERLALAHGNLTVVSSPGNGAALIATLPGIPLQPVAS
ncbi:MAG: sensor histidine kinase [Glaciihabitans sp.]|nr:sensor histidine kinase [Glaciihabitans sp.]